MSTAAVILDDAVAASTDETSARRSWRPRAPRSAGEAATWLLTAVLLVVTLFPFYWALRTALSDNGALSTNPSRLSPAEPSMAGFERALGLATTEEAIAAGGSGADVNFLNAMKNSLIVSTLVTVVQVFCCAMAAYAFARLQFWGRNALFFIVLTALMIPPIFTTLPNFVWVKDRGWLNTHIGIAAPTLLMTPFAIFFLRQFFLGLPREVEEAAFIDGSSRLRTFFQIILPMTASPLATLALLTFVTQWNEYLWSRLVGSDKSVRVLTASLGYFREQTPQGSPDWAGMMSAAILSMLPIVILLMVAGKRLVNSIQFSGIK